MAREATTDALQAENARLRARLQALLKAVEPLIEGLEYHPRKPHYYLRVQHEAVERLAREWYMAAQERTP